MLIDTHAHLEDKKFSRDLDRVLARAKDAGIERLVCIADDLSSSRRAVDLAKRFPFLRAAVGVHPQHDRTFRDDTLAELKELARLDSVVAIGEVGLDFHWDGFDRDRQFRVLASQAELASELSLPLVLHCRDAYPELIDFFSSNPDITSRGVVHCFSGTCDDAFGLLDLGFYLGVGGVITYPNGSHLRETIARVGLDRIVAETDSPYLPPQKKRGRRNEPSYMKFTIKGLADATGFTYQDVARITTANAVKLYGLDVDDTTEITYSVRNRLYVNVTNRCTNECCFCERDDDYRLLGHYLKLPGEPSASELLDAVGDTDRFEEVVICGLGEPTLRLDVVLKVAEALKVRGCRVRLNTNGHGNLIHGKNITSRLSGVFDSVTVTMNAHNKKTYNKISSPQDRKGAFDAMLDFTKKVKRHVPDVRMRVLALPEVDIEACRALAEDKLKVRFQVRAPRPQGYPVSTNGF